MRLFLGLCSTSARPNASISGATYITNSAAHSPVRGAVIRVNDERVLSHRLDTGRAAQAKPQFAGVDRVGSQIGALLCDACQPCSRLRHERFGCPGDIRQVDRAGGLAGQFARRERRSQPTAEFIAGLSDPRPGIRRQLRHRHGHFALDAGEGLAGSLAGRDNA